MNRIKYTTPRGRAGSQRPVTWQCTCNRVWAFPYALLPNRKGKPFSAPGLCAAMRNSVCTPCVPLESALTAISWLVVHRLSIVTPGQNAATRIHRHNHETDFSTAGSERQTRSCTLLLVHSERRDPFCFHWMSIPQRFCLKISSRIISPPARPSRSFE